MTRSRRVAAEFIGTAMLLAVVVGSGIMGERLAGGNGFAPPPRRDDLQSYGWQSQFIGAGYWFSPVLLIPLIVQSFPGSPIRCPRAHGQGE